MKTCRYCKEEKPLEEYTRHPTSRDGRDNACKECKRKANRERKAKRLAGELPESARAKGKHAAILFDLKVDCFDCGKENLGRNQRVMLQGVALCRSCRAKRFGVSLDED